MVFNSQLMYCMGSLLCGLGAITAFILGFRTMQKQEEANWREEWKEQIEIIDRPTQSVSG